MERRGARNALATLLSRIHVDSDGLAVKAEAEGPEERSFSCFVSGLEEGRVTGVLAALLAERLCVSQYLDTGVFHIDQPFDPVRFLQRVAGHTASRSAPVRPPS